MKDKEYLEQIKISATNKMMDSTQAVEDRFAAMIVALIAKASNDKNI